MEKAITIGEIKELTTKTGKPFIGITDTEGNRYNVFVPKLFPFIEAGKQVTLVGEENKGFFDVKDIKETTVDNEVVPKKIEIPNTTNTSIEKQVLAKLVSELWIADKLKDSDPEVKGLRRWMRDRLPMDLVDEAKVLGATEMATPEQIGRLKKLQEGGIKLGEVIKSKGLSATRASELTKEQAEAIINSLKV